MKKLLSALLGIFGLFIVPAYAALPSGYTELEYIASSGDGQYFDTGIAAKNGLDVAAKFEIDTTSTTSLMGTRYQGQNRFWPVAVVYYQGALKWNATINGDTPTGTVESNRVYTTYFTSDANGWKFSVDGTQISERSDVWSQSGNMWLFATNNSGEVQYPFKGKVYYVKIYDDGTLVRDFIPAKRNSDNVLGMYDTVSGTFFTNSGSGSFLPGEELDSCRNLFDKNGTLLNGTYNYTNGNWISNADFRTQDNIPAKPNVRYTVSVNDLRNGSNAFSLQAWDSNHQWLGTVAFDTAGSGSQTVITGTTPENTAFLSVSFAITYRNIDTLQIEEGSTATPYVPYDPLCATCDGTIVNYTSATGTVSQSGTPTPTNPIEPVFYQQGNMVLRKVGDYADTYDATTEKITRRVGVKVLDGTESWSYYSVQQGNMFRISIAGGVLGDKEILGVLCNSYELVVSGSRTNDTLSGTTKNYDFINNNYTTLEDWKAYLAEQYAAGTPVTIYYPLAEETTEDWPASYCEMPIKIATTKYNESAFSPLNTALANAISVVDTVVSNTITQAASIATLQAQKQTRPADDTCPAYKQCLLVEDEQGVPHWYEITDPFRDFVAPIIANNVAPASTTNSAGYTQLEYIESTGKSYIDTGIQITSNTKMSLTFKALDSTQGKYLFGEYVSNDGSFYVWGSGGYFQFAYGCAYVTSSQTWDTEKHTANFYIQNGRSIAEVDNRIVMNQGVLERMPASNIIIAGTNQASIVASRTYSAKFYNNNTLVRNFVPVKRNIDGAIGMYDTVTKTFFANAGTGTFTAGPVVANDADVPGATWTATWAADATTGVSASTVYGEGLCNAVAGTTVGEIATDAQMNSSDWSNNGTYCRCKIDGINTNGSDVDTTTNKWVWLTSTSSCLEKCAYYCSNSTKTATEFRNIMLNTAQ